MTTRAFKQPTRSPRRQEIETCLMNRPFFSVKTDLLKDGAVSRLYIARASKRDSGNYTCGMRNAQASVIVHILNGKDRIGPDRICNWINMYLSNPRIKSSDKIIKTWPALVSRRLSALSLVNTLLTDDPKPS